MIEYTLWHIFVINNHGREMYRGSRCSDGDADEFCAELRNGAIDSQHWQNAHSIRATKFQPGNLPVPTSVDMPTDREHTALHEAGHAVAAVQLGLDGQDYGSVTIIPSETMNGSFSMSALGSTVCEAQRDIVISCAGYGALRALGYPEHFASTGCGEDFSVAETLIRRWSLPPIDYWKDLTTQLFVLHENAQAVKDVAKNLIKYKTNGPEFIHITVGVAIGLLSQLEVEKFKLNCQAFDRSYWLE
jgi:hypothetical protein